MASKRSAIGQALRTRLKTILTTGGWPLSVKEVYYDKIPMGLELAPEELPAFFLLDDGAVYTHEHQAMVIAHKYRLQIVDTDEQPDDRMNELIRLAAKAIYADSPTAERTDAFRALHPAVFDFWLDEDETDLHMIDGNRIATLRMIVHYRSRPYDL